MRTVDWGIKRASALNKLIDIVRYVLCRMMMVLVMVGCRLGSGVAWTWDSSLLVTCDVRSIALMMLLVVMVFMIIIMPK